MKVISRITAVAFCLIANVAHAGPPESLARIIPRAEGSDVVGLAQMFARQNLMYSKDGGKTFAMLCMSQTNMSYVDERGDERVRDFDTFVTSVATHDGHLLVGNFWGLWTDDGNACKWQLDPVLGDTFVTGLAFDPHDDRIVYGLTMRGGEDNGLFRRNADGSVERLGVQEPMLYGGMHVVALDGSGMRVYSNVSLGSVTVLTNQDGTTTVVDLDAGPPIDDAGLLLPGLSTQTRYAIRYTDDLGATWTTHEVDVPMGFLFKLEAVDPSNPDRIVISFNKDNSYRGAAAILDQVLVSDDRGATFRPWLSVGSISGVTIAKDGTVFIGDRGEGMAGDAQGLWRASSVADEPKQIADYDVWCLEAREDALEVCTRFEWGTADTQSGAFTEALSVTRFEAFHSCGPGSIAVCRQDVCTENCSYEHWPDAPACKEHFPECGVVGSGIAAPVDAGQPASSMSDGCSCDVLGSGRPRAPHALWLALMLAVALSVRRKQRERQL